MYIFITILILIAAILMILITQNYRLSGKSNLDFGCYYPCFKYTNGKVYHFKIHCSSIAG